MTLPAGARLARMYYTASPYPLAWNSFRYVGPVNARWDRPIASADGAPGAQERGIYYAAFETNTCLAEVFQSLGYALR